MAAHADLLRDLSVGVMVYGECGAMVPVDPLDRPMSQRLPLASLDVTAYAARLTRFARALHDRWGLQLAYHHHLMMVAETFDEVSSLLDRTGPAVGLLMDTGHAAAAGFDYGRLIARFGDRIRHIHLKDVRPDVMARVRAGDVSFNQGVRSGMFTVPGEGSVDFQPLADFVRRSGYRGWLIVEAEQDPAVAEPLSTVSRARAFLRDLLEA